MRRTSIVMAVFAASFILMYAGVVLLIKFLYVYFRGFIPEFNGHLLRGIFYGLSALTIALSAAVSKKRYSPEGLRPRFTDIDALLKHLLLTPVISMAFAEAVLIYGFFLFFLRAMYLDFFVLATVSLAMIVWSVPSKESVSECIKKARNI